MIQFGSRLLAGSESLPGIIARSTGMKQLKRDHRSKHGTS